MKCEILKKLKYRNNDLLFASTHIAVCVDCQEYLVQHPDIVNPLAARKILANIEAYEKATAKPKREKPFVAIA